MRGNILNYSEENDTGIITGPGDSRYKFSKADWKESCPVISRVNVDFVVEGDRATEIYCTDTDAMTAAVKSIETAKAERIAQEESIRQKEIINKLEVDYSGYYRSNDKAMWKGVCAGLSHKTGIPLLIVRALFIYPGIFLFPLYYFRWSKWKERPTINIYSVGADKFAAKVNSAALIIGALAGKDLNGELSNTSKVTDTRRENDQAPIGRNEDQRSYESNKEASSAQVKYSSFKDSAFKPTTPVAITGAVIGKIGEDSFEYYEKCEACGFVRTYSTKSERRSSWQTTMGGTFYCPKCSQLQKVEIKTV